MKPGDKFNAIRKCNNKLVTRKVVVDDNKTIRVPAEFTFIELCSANEGQEWIEAFTKHFALPMDRPYQLFTRFFDFYAVK